MAKRFTDTEKWKDPWFEELSLQAKLFFFYFVDNCDHAGVLNCSLKRFNKECGCRYKESDLLSDFAHKIQFLENGRMWMPKFIDFQYGKLTAANNAHKGVFKSLEYNNINFDNFIMDGQNNTPKAIASRLSRKMKLELISKDFHRCTYCGFSGDDRTLSIGHIIPRSLGGENDESNLTTACAMCNSRKGESDVLLFIKNNQFEKTLSENLKSKLGLITSYEGLLVPKLGAQDKDKDTDKEKDKDKERITPELVFASWEQLGQTNRFYFMTPVQLQKVNLMNEAGLDARLYKEAIKSLARSKWFESIENKKMSLILSPEVIGLALQEDDPVDMERFLEELGLGD